MSKAIAIANVLDRANLNLQSQANQSASFTQKRATAIASTTGIDPVSDSVCRVRVSLQNCNWNDPKDLLLAVANTLGDGIIPVEGSYQQVSDGNNVFVGLVTRGIATCTIAESDYKERFTQIAKNVLMDNADQSVWDLVSNSDGQVVLARQMDENLNDLVAIARNRNPNNKDSHEVEVVHPVTAGYSRFYNPVINGIDHGYICGQEADGTIIAVSRALNDLVDVDPRMLVTCSNIHVDDNEYEIHAQLNRGGVECPAHLITAMASQRADSNPFARPKALALVSETEQPLDPESVSYEKVREYYKQMFAYSPEYYNEFEKLISESGF